MRWCRAVFALLMVFELTVQMAGSAIAQGSSGTVQLPIAPDPARCTVEPMPLADVTALWKEVEQHPATPTAFPSDLKGKPADDATVQEVTDFFVQLTACVINGNDGLRDAAFSTNEHLRESLAGFATEADFSAWYTDKPVALAPEDRLMLYAIRDVRVLADGRIVAEPEFIVPSDGQYRDIQILKRADGQLRIDQSQEGEENLYPMGG